MWTRSLLKENAKIVLRRTYWLSFLVCLVGGLLTGTSGAGANYAYSYQSASGSSGGNTGSSYIPPALAGLLATTALLFFAVAIVYACFVASPITVGYRRYFMEARGGNAPFSSLFSVFGKPGYLATVKTLFMTNLSIFLWSLLLVIPGIIKSYQYCMVPYILAERPDMDYRRAMELSRQMTDGEKWNIFVLQLSFIGWELLGVLCFGIGLLFVTPYVEATMAELYTALRTKAMSLGQTDASELPGFIAYP